MHEEQTYPETRNAQDIDQPDDKPDLVEHMRQYAHERPEVVALWCLGIGFVLGWKLKIW